MLDMWLLSVVCGCLQAVDSSVEPVTSCVQFYGAVYVCETLRVVESVKKDNAIVSWRHSRTTLQRVSR